MKSITSAFALLSLLACSNDVEDPIGACNGDLASDPDEDGIVSAWELGGDIDRDGYPSFLDDDSDGDGLLDQVEAGGSGCGSPPRDLDRDGTFDFLDTDANGDRVPDALELGDRDGDGTADWADLDTDGDGIENVMELDGDADGDGLPSSIDLDSDADTIADGDEGLLDADGDGAANLIDLDSDDDGMTDREEAGDGDLATPPVECPDEIELVSERFYTDGRPDFRDRDSDGDGLTDDAELAKGTALCNPDTDGDQWIDLYEDVFARSSCELDETTCACTIDPSCFPPPDDIFAVLPFEAEPIVRDAVFEATIRHADVFFLGTNGGNAFFGDYILDGALLAGAFHRTHGNLATAIRGLIPDAWIGSGLTTHFDHFSAEQTLEVSLNLTDPSDPGALAAFDIIRDGENFDNYATEALAQLVRGEPAEACPLEGSWGRACFRPDAIPFIVHVNDVLCIPNGPPGDSCGDFPTDVVDPPLHDWIDMVTELQRVGAVYIGMRSRGSYAGGGIFGLVDGGYTDIYLCDVEPEPDVPDPGCQYLAETARASGSVGAEGRPNAFGFSMAPLANIRLPDGSHPPHGDSVVVAALETALYNTRLHVDTVLRDDRTDLEGIDATRFVRSVVPACVASDPAETCWIARAPVPQDEAVAAVDETTFYATYGGTLVRFRMELANNFLEPTDEHRVFVMFVDARGDAKTVLDTRRVFIIVPPAGVI